MNVIAPWATQDDVLCGPCSGGEEATGIPPATLDAWLMLSSSILFNLTGQQWPGEQTDVVRPNPPNGRPCACGCGPARRGCSFVSEIQLDGYPVIDVIEVMIDGEVVDDSVYRVDDRQWLVWQADDGGVEIAGRLRRGWPCCQRQKRPASEDQTFQVEYTWGTAPPPGGALAASSLACEFALACSTSEDSRRRCRLSSKVKSIVRQGVSMELSTAVELFAQGSSGLPEVDLWVASIMAGRERRRSGFIDTQQYALRGRRHRRGPEPVGS